jgi:anti-sigma regulatory factor (Ser/Thr protein kinase)
MTSNGRRLRHTALVYQSQDEYVIQSVAFLREGLEASEGAIVAHTPSGLAVMREELGSDAELVKFVDVGTAYTRPVQTLAAYHKVFADQLQKTASLRAVADVQFGPDPREWDLWMGYEAIFNHSFSHLPAWVWCSYNASGKPDRLLETVWRTHPDVLSAHTWNTSTHYEDPVRLLREITPEPAPLSGLRSIPFGRDSEEFRERLGHEMVAERVSEAKALDMLVAANEIATNAVEHGGGVEHVRVGRAEGRFVCEIIDRGIGFDDPSAGYLAPRPGIGSGLWVARQLTWLIEFFQSPNGFTTRIWL